MKINMRKARPPILLVISAIVALAPTVIFVPAFAQGTFTPTGSMATARYVHFAVGLLNGKTLIVGGNDGSSDTATAELYDPVTGTFSPTGSMTTLRAGCSFALLTDGRVLVAGGGSLATAELYDPTTGTFSPTGSMSIPRTSASATRLSTGEVLIAGGINSSTRLLSAELYDPLTGTFSPTGSMGTPRAQQTATFLADGRVLIAGGENICFYSSAELYDPTTGSFAPTGTMTTSRVNHSATLMNNGKVLIAGGFTGCFGSASVLGSAELFDPISGTFSATANMNVKRVSPVATLLPAGGVLITGGCTDCSSDNPDPSSRHITNTAEIYDPTAVVFTLTGNMNSPRAAQTANLLASGKVLLTGGVSSYNPFVVESSAELFAPPTGVGPPTNKEQCKQGGWQTFTIPRKFKNQGDCVQNINTGK